MADATPALEYQVVWVTGHSSPVNAADIVLNEFGQEGWEVVQVVQSIVDFHKWYAVIKRVKQDGTAK